jgi:hypothetical protein
MIATLVPALRRLASRGPAQALIRRDSDAILELAKISDDEAEAACSRATLAPPPPSQQFAADDPLEK